MDRLHTRCRDQDCHRRMSAATKPRSMLIRRCASASLRLLRVVQSIELPMREASNVFCQRSRA
eukprot:4693703-Amphidinium_carterae.2